MRIIKKFRAVKIVALCGTLLPGLFLCNSAFATENIDYNVSVASSLTLTIPTSSIVLNLDPSSKTFDSEDLTVSVGTNNKTGYTLTLSTPNNNTDLNRDSSSDSIVATMPTLPAGTYSQTTFVEDKWGYSINSNTAIPSTITSGFVPFVSGNKLMESSTAVNHDETELTFAAKIDYLQPAGSYATQLNFNLVANPLVDYIQDFTIDMCRTLASSADYTVVDKRDNNDYTVRYINGNCWMTQNLRFVGKTGDPAGTMTLDSTTSNVESTYTPSSPLTISYGDLTAGDTYDYARIHNSGDTTTGVWYNYAATSAMTTIGSSNSTVNVYNICPAGWRLPTEPEQQSIFSYKADYHILGAGYYVSGAWRDGGIDFWSSSTPTNAQARQGLYATSSVFTSTYGNRIYGYAVRCIANDSRDLNDSTVVNMQDINKQIVANTANGATKTLIDSRDGQEYTVAKINGNLWMTRNLAIGCNGSGSTYGNAIVAGGKALTPANTNIAFDWTTPTALLSQASASTQTTDYTDARIQCNTTYGAYYNEAAASAGTITGTSNSTEDAYNICPNGWTVPSRSEANTLSKGPFNPTNGGHYYNGNLISTQHGYWWLSTAYDSQIRNILENLSSGAFDTNNYGGYRHNFGFYVRCIAK